VAAAAAEEERAAAVAAKAAGEAAAAEAARVAEEAAAAAAHEQAASGHAAGQQTTELQARHEVAAGEFIEVCIEAASQDACAASRVELQARRAESELRALLVEGPDDADVIKLLAQSTAALEALETESEPGAAHADRTARTEQADDARQPGNAPEDSPQGSPQGSQASEPSPGTRLSTPRAAEARASDAAAGAVGVKGEGP